MATARKPNSMMTNPRGDAMLTDESRSRTTSGDTNDLRRWPLFSTLSRHFLQSVRLYYVFEQLCPNESKTFFVTHNDEVWALGINDNGCLGTCSDDPCSIPVKVAALSGRDVQSFAHGMRHVIALTGKGEVFAWGDNKFFQVGEAEPGKICLPTLVYDRRDPALEIACGSYHSACRTTEGNVYCWGYNSQGQIGTGNNINQRAPRRVLGLIADLKCTGISCQALATVAVFENGQVYVWGNNREGELGIGSEESPSVPVKVDVESAMIKKVVSGFFHTLALADDGLLYVWGRNNRAQLGTYLEDTKRRIIRLASLKKWHGRIIDITTSRSMSAAMTEDFQALVWGVTRKGELRIPTEVSGDSLQDAFAKMAPSFATPVPVVTVPTSVISIATAPVAQDSSPLTDWGRNWLNTLIEHFDNPAISDVKFVLQEKIIHAHKTLLNLQSEYFRKMFEGPWRDNEGNTIEVTGSSYPVYRAFVRYFYTGNVDVEVSDALELLDLAALCSEHALVSICHRRIEEMISVENCASVYLVSVCSAHTDLENACMRFAVDHMTAVTRTSAFGALPQDILSRFLSGVAERGVFKS